MFYSALYVLRCNVEGIFPVMLLNEMVVMYYTACGDMGSYVV